MIDKPATRSSVVLPSLHAGPGTALRGDCRGNLAKEQHGSRNKRPTSRDIHKVQVPCVHLQQKLVDYKVTLRPLIYKSKRKN